MYTFELLKYSSLLSVPLFGIVGVLLIQKTKGFQPTSMTLSETILLLKKPIHIVLFKLNFVFKTILDFGFVWYLIQKFNLSVFNPLSLTSFFSVLSFGSLTFITEKNYPNLHKILAYICGILWGISQILLSYHTYDEQFIIFSYGLTFFGIFLAFFLLFLRKINIATQTFCMLFPYSWLVMYVWFYL